MASADTPTEVEVALWPMTNEEIEGVRTLLGQIEVNGNAVGDYTDKCQVYETGFSLHIKWEHKVPVMTTASDAVGIFVGSPPLLANACRRLIAAHDESERLRVALQSIAAGPPSSLAAAEMGAIARRALEES